MSRDDIAYIIEVKQFMTQYSMKVDLTSGKFVVGIFVQGPDYTQLKEENQWRFVKNHKIKQWEQSQNTGLTDLIDGKSIDTITVL
jgi:hypothetical protein